MKHTTCPACQSPNSRKATGQFASKGNQAFKNRICLNCGTAWRPQCPYWAAILILLAGCAIPIAWFTIQASVVQGMGDLNSLMDKQSGNSGYGGQNTLFNGVILAIGLSAVAYGIMVLIGKAGKIAILGRVEGGKK